MLNARTWHRLCVSAYAIFPAWIIGWIYPDSPILLSAVAVVTCWAVLVAVLGAILGVRLAFGRLYMGCPGCNAKSFVSAGDRDGMHIHCPNCGELRIKLGSFFGLKIIKCGSHEDDLAEFYPSTNSILLAPKRHFIPFMIIFTPVVASIIAASLIHEFTFFYLLIPGVWCFAVGAYILDGIFGGSLSDNHGTALRSKAPFRFWVKLCVWSLFYIFAAAFPIAYSVQERAKVATTIDQGEER